MHYSCFTHHFCFKAFVIFQSKIFQHHEIVTWALHFMENRCKKLTNFLSSDLYRTMSNSNSWTNNLFLFCQNIEYEISTANIKQCYETNEMFTYLFERFDFCRTNQHSFGVFLKHNMKVFVTILVPHVRYARKMYNSKRML